MPTSSRNAAPARAGPPRPGSGRLLWAVALAAIALYAVAFAYFIDRHTSLPFFDGYDYVHKTDTIAEAIQKGGMGNAINPMTYLSAEPRQRPPLMMAAAAILLGKDATPQQIAGVWLVIRVLVLVSSLAILTKVFPSSRFVAALALLILANPLSLTFYRLYMVDEPFGLFGLLALALLLYDDQRETPASSSLTSLAMLALLLVKPVAAVFLLPLLATRAARFIWKWRAVRRIGGPILWQRAAQWAIPYIIAGALAAWLVLASPYGIAAAEQYRLGASTGYWTSHISLSQAARFAALLVTPVLLGAALSVLPVLRKIPGRFVLIYGGALLAWWLLFSLALTYSVEDRLIGQAMPAVVAAATVFVCQDRKVARALTIAAGIFFLLQVSFAQGLIDMPAENTLRQTMAYIAPLADKQMPTPEIGLVRIGRELNQAIPRDKPVRLIAVFGAFYLEPGALNYALEKTAEHPPTMIHAEWVPIEPRAFDFAALCRNEWFLTCNAHHASVYEKTGLFVSIEALHRLLTDPQSPLRPYLTEAGHGQVFRDNPPSILTLWQLREPPPAVQLAALKWILPDFMGSKHEAYIREQIQALEKAVGGPTAPATSLR